MSFSLEILYITGELEESNVNDSEARRRELLRQTRELYDDNRFIPAIHPRYGNIYRELYGREEEQATSSSFFLRLGVTLLCFAFYVWLDTSNATVMHVNSGQIINQIEKQIEVEDIREAWQDL